MPQQQTQLNPSKVKFEEAWKSPESFASTLLVLFVDKYDQEGLSWSPETIWLQTEQDIGEIPRQNYDRLMSAIMLVTTDWFYNRLPYYIEICNVLSGDSFDPGTFRPADVADCAWGTTEAMLIGPPDTAEPFSDIIRRYIGHALDAEGFLNAPDILRIGVRDTAQTNDAATEGADSDDGMWSAIYQNQEGKTQEITEMVKDNLQRLLQQIESLPLVNGDASELRKRLGEHIRPEVDEAKHDDML